MKKDKKKFNEIISFIKSSENVLNTVTANINMLVRPHLTSIFKTNKLYKNPYNFSNKVTPLLNVINKNAPTHKTDIFNAKTSLPHSPAEKTVLDKQPYSRFDSNNISASLSVNPVLNKIFNNTSNSFHTTSQNPSAEKNEPFVTYLPPAQTILQQNSPVSYVYSPLRKISPVFSSSSPLPKASLVSPVFPPLRKISPVFSSSTPLPKASIVSPIFPPLRKISPVFSSPSPISKISATLPVSAPLHKSSPISHTASALRKIASHSISTPLFSAAHTQIGTTAANLASPLPTNTYLQKSWNKLRETISLPTHGNTSNINVSPNISVEVKQSPHSNNFNEIWSEIGRRLKNELASSTDGLY